jgi:mannose-6-phosphate isomerase
LRLAQQFPGDSGAMAPLFLNYLLIAPGESFFMAANEPHAYVAGEIIECMACSDNVVRLYRRKYLNWIFCKAH